jgi:hypothetical protein
MSNPLYSKYDPVARRSTEVSTDPDTGKLVFIHAQNTTPIVESAKRIASSFDRHAKRPDDWVHVARIPLVIWQHLQRLGITKDPMALNAWLNDSDQRVFRTDDGRRL